MALVKAPSVSVSPRVPTIPGNVRERTIVWVGGEQDIATRIELSDSIALAAARDDADLFVDLSAVTFMDASTVGAIVGGRNLLRSSSRQLSVRAPSVFARRVLDLCGLASFVEQVDAPQAAGATVALVTWVDVPRAERARSAPAVPGESRPARTVKLTAAPESPRKAGALVTVETDGDGP